MTSVPARNDASLDPCNVQGGIETWSCTPAFALELVVGEDGYTSFQPSFPQLEDVCLQALDQCVSATNAIPRVGSTSGKGMVTELQLHHMNW